MSTVQKRSALFSRRAQKEFSPAAFPAFHNQAVEERVFSLFQPDVLLPSQYLATTKSKNYQEPEKRLMLAVLEDAVWCFQNGLLSRDNKKKRGLSSDAEEWIMEKDGDWLFSFNEICELLGLEPKYVRKYLVRWKEEALSGRVAVKVYRLSHNARRNGKTAAGTGDKRHRFLNAAGF